MKILIGLIVIAIVVIIYLIRVYNTLVAMNEKINVSWSQIDVVLKQRADLIPNLVETIKGAGNYEKDTLTSIVEARNKVLGASTQKESIEANSELSQTLSRLLSLTEAYPDLKVNQNFLNLQSELSGLENKIAKYRQFFNDMVYDYNRYRQAFPKSFVASMFHFEKADYIEMSEEEKNTPHVKF